MINFFTHDQATTRLLQCFSFCKKVSGLSFDLQKGFRTFIVCLSVNTYTDDSVPCGQHALLGYCGTWDNTCYV